MAATRSIDLAQIQRQSNYGTPNNEIDGGGFNFNGLFDLANDVVAGAIAFKQPKSAPKPPGPVTGTPDGGLAGLLKSPLLIVALALGGLLIVMTVLRKR